MSDVTKPKKVITSAIEAAIQEAVDHGFQPSLEAFPEMEHFSLVQIAAAMTGDVFIDPAFWRALGKARRWTTDEDFKRWQGSVAEWNAQYWKTHWHALIDHLADGRDAESFFAGLPGKPKG
jgi:hypothetical protein